MKVYSVTKISSFNTSQHGVPTCIQFTRLIWFNYWKINSNSGEKNPNFEQRCPHSILPKGLILLLGQMWSSPPTELTSAGYVARFLSKAGEGLKIV